MRYLAAVSTLALGLGCATYPPHHNITEHTTAIGPYTITEGARLDVRRAADIHNLGVEGLENSPLIPFLIQSGPRRQVSLTGDEFATLVEKLGAVDDGDQSISAAEGEALLANIIDGNP